MTVVPLAGVTGPRLFATKTKYEIAIDTNGDAIEDQVYSVVFGKPDAAGKQRYTLKGPSKLRVKGATDDTNVVVGSGGKFFAGYRDDPFFFDLIGFKRGLSFSETTSRNFFDGLNTMALVLEVPTNSFGRTFSSDQDIIGVWARTVKGRRQIDRMGRPAINTVLIGSADKDAFNATAPRNDVATWSTKVIANLVAPPLSRSSTDAAALVSVLLPDILTFAPANTAGFLNGRKLEDDVIDAELNLLSNGAVTTDFVDNDSVFLTVFPYLAAPNP
jgi:hypothetical protein